MLLKVPESNIDIRERSPLALAFLGDGVLELLVRARLVAGSRLPPGALHHEAAKIVSAKGQWTAMETLMPMLTDAEASVWRRGRNASKATVPKSATPEQYRASTGIEAVFGWLYLREENARIEQLFEPIWQHYVSTKPGAKTAGSGGNLQV